MNLKKTEIMEYIVAFIGVVGLLAYIHISANAYQPPAVGQASPLVTQDYAGTVRSDWGNSAIRLRELVLAEAQM